MSVIVLSSSRVLALTIATARAHDTLADAVIYAYTPEAFPTSTRGTACGIASALSRLAGIAAPIITGLLLSINVSAPLFLSSVCFFVTAACAIMLPIETRVKGRRGTVMASH